MDKFIHLPERKQNTRLSSWPEILKNKGLSEVQDGVLRETTTPEPAEEVAAAPEKPVKKSPAKAKKPVKSVEKRVKAQKAAQPKKTKK